MRSIKMLALSLLTVVTLVSCSSTTNRSVAADDEAEVVKEHRAGKRLLTEEYK